MDLTLTDEQREIREWVRTFVRKELLGLRPRLPRLSNRRLSSLSDTDRTVWKPEENPHARAVIVATTRSPIGRTPKGSLAGMRPDELSAQIVQAALADGRFLVLPHPEVAAYYTHRATEPDRWLAGMNRLQPQVDAEDVTA